jgi:hypothetical protein
MIVKSIQRNVVESHDFKSEIATIDANEMRYISSLLRNNYSNVVLATARETIANAVDANKGSSRDVEITAPTRLSPTFVVRDFGAGLSESDLFGLYTKYGRSTKRSDNDSIGGFGIGRFAPLSYTDSFTVTSRHKGNEIVISVYVDEHGDTRFTKLSDTSTSEPSGVEISVAVKSEDISNFECEINKVIRFSDEKFVCKGFSRLVPEWVIKNADWGVERNRRSDPIIVMGGISYPLNLDSLANHPIASSKIYKAFSNSYVSNFFVFFFPVGSVALHHSRENLEYNAQTKNFIARAISKLETEIKTQVQKEIDAISDSAEFFKKLYTLSGSNNLESLCCDANYNFTDANKNVIKINGDPIVPLAIYRKSRNTRNLVRLSKKTQNVEKTISAKTFYAGGNNWHIIINDNVKNIQDRVNGLMTSKGIDGTIYVVSLADAESKLLYKHNSCDHIHLASKLTPVSPKSKEFNNIRKIFSNSHWSYSFKEKVPMPSDPFYYVDIKHNGGSNYDILFGDLKDFGQSDFRQLWKIARHFGINYDTVYGILDRTDLPAHAINLHDVFMPKFKTAIAQFKSILNTREEKEVRRDALPMIAHWEHFRKELPDNHPISVYFDLWNISGDIDADNSPFSDEQKKEFNILCDFPRRCGIDKVVPTLDPKISEKIKKEALTIKETYPMMFALFEGRYGSFYGIQNAKKLVLDYINLVDNRNS